MPDSELPLTEAPPGMATPPAIPAQPAASASAALSATTTQLVNAPAEISTSTSTSTSALSPSPSSVIPTLTTSNTPTTPLTDGASATSPPAAMPTAPTGTQATIVQESTPPVTSGSVLDDGSEFWMYGGLATAFVGLILCFMKGKRLVGAILLIVGIVAYFAGGLVYGQHDFRTMKKTTQSVVVIQEPPNAGLVHNLISTARKSYGHRGVR